MRAISMCFSCLGSLASILSASAAFCCTDLSSSEAGLHTIRAPVSEQIARTYGYVVEHTLGTARFHTGVDYAVPPLRPVLAGGAGQVTGTGGGEGDYWLNINYGGGLTVRYAHLADAATLRGACVRDRQVLGWAGGKILNGRATLHVEFRLDNKLVDPNTWLSHETKPAITDR